mmetsp:Transcript_50771/g.114131  ORF Transcript_50771/g.114131 Transcript_50771/m.114131 type:complete len:200 (+) Transcript_50771:86-685(+)
MPWRCAFEVAAEREGSMQQPGKLLEPAISPSLGYFQASPRMASPVPGPMTPTSEEEEALLPTVAPHLADAGDSLRRTAVCRARNVDSTASSRKRRKTAPGSPSPWLEMVDSQTSTAAPASAVPSPAVSPQLSPATDPGATPAHARGGALDYSSLSVNELKEQLGVQGTGIAADWEQAELVALLEELDRICMPLMSPLEI